MKPVYCAAVCVVLASSLPSQSMAAYWANLPSTQSPTTAQQTRTGGLGDWYTHGAQAFFAVSEAYNAGALEPDDLLAIVNDHAQTYYTHPLITVADSELVHASPSLRESLSRARGFIYLNNLNAQLIEASEGTMSLYDLAAQTAQIQARQQDLSLQDWVALVRQHIGDDAQTTFDDMINGVILTPRPDSLGPCFSVKTKLYSPWQLGFDETRMDTITGLDPQSNAAKAGVVEGDKIIALSSLDTARADDTKALELTVGRDGQSLSFSFVPRKPAVGGFYWDHNPELNRYGCGADDASHDAHHH